MIDAMWQALYSMQERLALALKHPAVLLSNLLFDGAQARELHDALAEITGEATEAETRFAEQVQLTKTTAVSPICMTIKLQSPSEVIAMWRHESRGACAQLNTALHMRLNQPDALNLCRTIGDEVTKLVEESRKAACRALDEHARRLLDIVGLAEHYAAEPTQSLLDLTAVTVFLSEGVDALTQRAAELLRESGGGLSSHSWQHRTARAGITLTAQELDALNALTLFYTAGPGLRTTVACLLCRPLLTLAPVPPPCSQELRSLEPLRAHVLTAEFHRGTQHVSVCALCPALMTVAAVEADEGVGRAMAGDLTYSSVCVQPWYIVRDVDVHEQ